MCIVCPNPNMPRSKYCEIHRLGKKCIIAECIKSAQGKTDKCKSHGGGARCIEPNCTKSARGNSDKCIEHGGGRRCIELNCTKSARENSDKCKAHGGGRRCIVADCKKSAQGKTYKCKSHGGGRRCIEPNCTKSARENSDKCVEHGGGRRCIVTDCTKSAQAKTDKCIEHGGGRRCIEPNCTKSARNLDKCIEHGGGRRCIEPNCKKSARGNSDKCIEHGGGRRCPNCISWIDSRSGSNKYDGFCATCFKRIFPEDPRSSKIHEHTKEIRVRNAIREEFQGFVHDKPLYTGNCDCTHRRRIDHRKLIGNTIIAVETDEYAHRGYDEKDEEIRYDDLYMIHSGKWIFIRFNPDITKTQNTDIEDRIVVLLEIIEEQINRVEKEENTELVEIIKLFY